MRRCSRRNRHVLDICFALLPAFSRQAVAEEQKQNMYATLMPPALPAPNMPAGSYPPQAGGFAQGVPGSMPPGAGGPMPPYGMPSM